jgi:hypothetical protein
MPNNGVDYDEEEDCEKEGDCEKAWKEWYKRKRIIMYWKI